MTRHRTRIWKILKKYKICKKRIWTNIYEVWSFFSKKFNHWLIWSKIQRSKLKSKWSIFRYISPNFLNLEKIFSPVKTLVQKVLKKFTQKISKFLKINENWSIKKDKTFASQTKWNLKFSEMKIFRKFRRYLKFWIRITNL